MSRPVSTSSPQSVSRTLSIWDAMSTVVGIIVGSGIFIAPSAIASVAPHPLTAALLWILGGTVAGFGALCYAECGTRLPHNGGFVVFYAKAWGTAWAFVAGWAAVLLTYPASLAGIAMIGAFYLGEAIPALQPHQSLGAAGLLLTAGVLNSMGLQLSRWAQRGLSAAKLLALLALVLGALFVPATGMPLDTGPAAPWWGSGSLLGAFAVLMWTYDGWTDVTLIAGEVRDPGRTLARAVIFGLGTVAILYALIQAAVLRLLPAQVAAESPQVVALAVSRALGPTAGGAIAWLISLIALGAVHSCVFVMARLVSAMADQGALPRFLAARSQAPEGTPRYAVLAVVALAAFYLVTQSFGELLRLFSFAVWLYYGATALTLVRLRRHGVGEPLPYSVRGAWASPYVLLAAAGTMTALQVQENPVPALSGIGLVVALGFIFWLRGTIPQRIV